MKDFFKELIEAFQGESEDLVRAGGEALMALEADQDEQTRQQHYDSLGRCLHTLKGSAATCGLIDVSELAHKLEDLLAPLKKENTPLPPDTADLLLTGLDRIGKRSQAHAQGKGDSLAALSKEFPQLFGESGEETSPAAQDSAPGGEEGKQAELGWRVQASQVKAMNRDVERLRELQLGVEERRSLLVDALHGLEADYKKGIPLAARLAAMDQVEAGLRHDAEAAAALVESMEESLQALGSLSVGAAWNSLHRVVRDTCRETGKKARLSLVGSELRLDRQVLERLQGPLVHLVRNAIDHGIEDPREREAGGKHGEGVVTLRVEIEGNLARIEVSDDGAGINLDALRRKAAEAGKDGAAMSEQDLIDQLFVSGFSTKETVSRISGRGVGLDAVRDQVRSLKGNLDIDHKAGHGTRFILTLPLEIGALPLLVVKSGFRVFGIPTAAVDQVVHADESVLDLEGSSPRLRHRDSWIPCADLGGMLRLRAPQTPEKGNALLVVQYSGQRAALRVDSLVGDAERVVMPLPPEAGAAKPYQGAAVHVGRELLLVLKPSWLVREGNHKDSAARSNRVLVIDDSLTARAMHRAILESGGYTVHAVDSAQQGLDLVRRGGFSAVVCDVQMAGMDGLAFTREMRRKPWGRDLPVLLVSTADSPEAVSEGLAAGASAYLSKMDCANGNLLAAMQNLEGVH